jgi:glycosyltransferase involved in cell wall biosynthesis
MSDNLLVVINNEKVSEDNNEFYSRNYNFKILPEGLNNYHKVKYIVRKSTKKENHKMNLQNVKIASNIIQFIYFVIATFKNKNSKYFIITISPYTFISFLFLFLFRKKVFVYLISSGHEEWKFILGSWSVWIYHIMYSIVTSNSTVIVLHDRLCKKKNCHVITSSTLDEKWLKNYKDVRLDKIRFLYVARVNPEKGIYEFLEMFEKIKLDAEISIVGNIKNSKVLKKFKVAIGTNKNIKFLGYMSDRQSLIDAYDNHNILILPSFTEGQPYVVDESLSRRRPVIIFEDIAHIIKERKGIFVSKRTIDSFCETTKHVMQNYNEIQKSIEKNKFPLEKDMLKQISNIISQ